LNYKIRNMGKIAFQKKNWSEVKEKVKQLNPLFFDIIERTVKGVKDPYVYEMSCPFYVDIISQGKSNLFDEDFLEGDKDSKANLLRDFDSLDTQPLSFITDGLVEVYNYNSYIYGSYGNVEYSYPLRIFKQGEIFGTYEVADYLANYSSSKYQYSVSSGHHSIYPLLPDPEKGSKSYKKDVGHPYAKRLKGKGNSSKDKYSILDIFPLMIKEVAQYINYRTKFFIFPTFWHLNTDNHKNHLNDFVMKQSWIQTQASRQIQANLYQRQKKIRKLDLKFAQTKATYLNYLNLAKHRKAPVLKFHMHTQYEYLNELSSYISEITHDHYPVIMMIYDYLNEVGKEGIIPVATFPFETSSSTSIRNSGEFIDEIGEFLLDENNEFWDELASRTYKISWSQNPVIKQGQESSTFKRRSTKERLYLNNDQRMNISEYFKMRFPDSQRAIYSQNIFTKCIIEMAR